MEHPVFGYTFRPEKFNKAIINWLKRRHQWEIKEKWINFSPGIVPGINMSVLAFSKPGDKILVQPPVYFPFFSAVKDHQRELIYNELSQKEDGSYEIDFEDFENKLKNVELFIFCSPHNPVGRVWTREELIRIGNLCLKHNVKILSDEIHSDLILPNHKHIPLASISKDISDITLTFVAPTKTFNIAGLNNAVAISTNEKLLQGLQSQIEALHLNMSNIFGSIAFEAAYNDGDNWVDELNKYINSNIDYVETFLKQNLPQIKFTRPEATYLLWLDFKALELKEEDLNNFLVKEAKLGFNYGSMFGPGGDGFQRMNVACSKKIVIKAMDQLSDALQKLKK